MKLQRFDMGRCRIWRSVEVCGWVSIISSFRSVVIGWAGGMLTQDLHRHRRRSVSGPDSLRYSGQVEDSAAKNKGHGRRRGC
jgi:hypothetical protein